LIQLFREWLRLRNRLPKMQEFPGIAPASAINASIRRISTPTLVLNADSFDEPALSRLAFVFGMAVLPSGRMQT
jgi:hypothetical protein